MKKWIIRILSAAAAIALCACLWLYFYHNQKNPDNIPSKDLMMTFWEEKGEDYALDQIEGYSRDALILIWGEPDHSLFGFFGDIWAAEGGTMTVYYNTDGIVRDILFQEAE